MAVPQNPLTTSAMRLAPESCYGNLMAQKKQNEVDGWLSRPDPSVSLILVYGPDRGLVSERAARFAAKTGLALDDPFAVVKFDALEVERDPGRIHDEAATVPLFGGRRLIWVRNVGIQKSIADMAKVLVVAPPRDATILLEAGDLKKSAPLRTVFEASPCAMALPCYGDEGRAIDDLIEAALAPTGMSISQQARQALKSSLGGDRMASRGEIEKLMLYCSGRDVVELEDVLASTGDASSISAETVIDALLQGRVADMDERMRRFLASGAAPFLLLSAALRQFQALSVYRQQMDSAGRGAAAVVAAARPPVFFARRSIIETALARWSAANIAQALDRLQRTVLATRRQPALVDQIISQTLLALAVAGARIRRR